MKFVKGVHRLSYAAVHTTVSKVKKFLLLLLLLFHILAFWNFGKSQISSIVLNM